MNAIICSVESVLANKSSQLFRLFQSTVCWVELNDNEIFLGPLDVEDCAICFSLPAE